MKIKFILLIIFTSLSVYSQQQFSMIGNLKLVSGEEIINCKVGFRTYGKMNEDRSNVILYPSWFGGTSAHLANLIGEENKPLDSTKFFIVAVDALGNGISSSPSNSNEQPLRNFPDFTIKDMVNSQKLLLKKEFELENIYAVYGGSMGGMQVFEWLVSYPGFMKKALPYVATPRVSSSDVLLWQSELSMINACLECGCNQYELGKAITLIHNFAVQTTDYKNRTISSDSIFIHTEKLAENFSKTFIPENWASQLKAMLSHNVADNSGNSLESAAEKVKAELFVIVGKRDQMVNPKAALEFAEYAGGKTLVIDNDCGHLAPGCDYQNFVNAVREFLN